MRLYRNLMADLCGAFVLAFSLIATFGCSSSLDSSAPFGDGTNAKANQSVVVGAAGQNADSSNPQPRRESSTGPSPALTVTSEVSEVGTRDTASSGGVDAIVSSEEVARDSEVSPNTTGSGKPTLRRGRRGAQRDADVADNTKPRRFNRESLWKLMSVDRVRFTGALEDSALQEMDEGLIEEIVVLWQLSREGAKVAMRANAFDAASNPLVSLDSRTELTDGPFEERRKLREDVADLQAGYSAKLGVIEERRFRTAMILFKCLPRSAPVLASYGEIEFLTFHRDAVKEVLSATIANTNSSRRLACFVALRLLFPDDPPAGLTVDEIAKTAMSRGDDNRVHAIRALAALGELDALIRVLSGKAAKKGPYDNSPYIASLTKKVKELSDELKQQPTAGTLIARARALCDLAEVGVAVEDNARAALNDCVAAQKVPTIRRDDWRQSKMSTAWRVSGCAYEVLGCHFGSRGETQKQDQEYDAAIAHYTRAIQLVSGTLRDRLDQRGYENSLSDALTSRAKLYARWNRHEKALLDWNQLERNMPRGSFYYYHEERADSLLALGRAADASFEYHAACSEHLRRREKSGMLADEVGDQSYSVRFTVEHLKLMQKQIHAGKLAGQNADVQWVQNVVVDLVSGLR